MSSLLLVLALLLAALAVYVLLVEPYRLGTTHVRAPVRALPAALEGYRIVVLSDLHHWPWVARGHVRRAVRLALEARPDVVVLLGDYSVSFDTKWPRLSAWLYERALAQLTPILRPLHAPDGVLAILGNHDHYAGAEHVARWLPAIGARLLRNDGVVIRRGEATLVVGGVDDWFEGTVDPHGGCDGLPPDAPTVVLAHAPDAIRALAPTRRIDLVLAGHTHGGQFVIPGLGAPVTFSSVATSEHAAGWVPNARAPLFVSRGIGVQVPGRFNAPPEVVVVELVSDGAPAAVAPGARHAAGAVA